MTVLAENSLVFKTPIDDQTIRRHMPLVRRIARKIAFRAAPGMMADDLISAGAFGLLDSIRKNKSENDISSACYMRMRIRGAIYDEMRSCNWLPRKKKQNDGEASPAAPAASIVHLEDLPAGADTTGPETDRPDNPFEALDAKRTAQSLNQALDTVSSRDRLVLHLHYFRGMPVREIGRLLGVSDARVSQIHHRALERIRLVLATA